MPSVGDQFPPELDGVFRRMLAKDQRDRPASVLALARELRIAAFGISTTLGGIPIAGRSSGSLAAILATPSGPLPAVPAPAPAPPKRRLWPLAAGVVVVLAGGVAAFTLMSGARHADAESAAQAPVAPAPEPTPAPPAAPPIGEAPPAAVTPATVRATVAVEIASTPRGAEVYRLPSETKVGATPWKAELPSEAGTQVFLIRKAGFADRRVEIDLRTGGTQTVTLLRAPRRPATPPAGTGSVRRKGEPVDPFRKGKS